MEYTIRPMQGTEPLYCFAQSQQLSMQTGLVGHLRADFGSSGTEFWTSFFDCRESLKTDAFKAEFQDVIEGLRNGGCLASRHALLNYCFQNPESSLGEGREYGFRLDTDYYTYMLRLNPNKGEYNIYCYCYMRNSLERHMERASQGIRFIDSRYNELFRILDGGKVSITAGFNGMVNEKPCRYIDEYHAEIGKNIYHICEFAELMENNGNSVAPVSKEV